MLINLSAAQLVGPDLLTQVQGQIALYGCGHGQLEFEGLFFAKPMGPDALMAWVHQHQDTVPAG
jgi:EAL domain-containing protein (putative c-di-GMP-specific phosphodiesterase class I)